MHHHGGKMVRGLRLSARLTQEELAERAGLSVRTIRYLERGRGAPTPRLKSVEMVAAALELNRSQTEQLLELARNSHVISRPRPGVEDETPGSDNAAPRTGRCDSLWPEATPSEPPHGPTGNSSRVSPGNGPNPAQLPFSAAELIGREGVCGDLDRHLTTRLGGSAPALLAITGMPGVGKTALALNWSNARAGSFPDGQLYVDLRGFQDNAPMTPSAALRGFLAALGHRADTLPEDVHELSSTYRTALAGRRMLILLDNAQSADQVRPLLPNSPGSVTVVTSRSRLAGLTIRDGAVRIDLGCLPENASVRLLAKIIGTDRVHAEPEAAAALVSLCGNLPLALHIMAERLARHSDTLMSEWVDVLTGNPDRLDDLDIPGDPTTSLRAVFSWSYLALPAATSRLFRLLGLSGEPEFEASQVKLAFCEEEAIEAGLAMLVDSHLLTSPAPGRFRLHELVRLYARERAVAEENSEDLADFARRLRRGRRGKPTPGTSRLPLQILMSKRAECSGAVPTDERRLVVHKSRWKGSGDRRPNDLGSRGGISGEADLARLSGPGLQGVEGCPLGLLDSEC
ncbi:NB-ARC domain-containing protein [Streptomyces sp. NPDC006544]|uniref:ATP-binding protein n=1 Tax=Streptomyces sp. NPDC006544 TaxID=3154583 RepID=UPI0033A01BE8